MQHPIGVCTWIYGSRDLEVVARRLHAQGLAGCEIFLGEMRPDLREIRALFHNFKLKLYSLTPVNVDLASEETETRQAARSYYKQLVRDAHDLGIPMITCHGLVKARRQRPAQSRNALLESVYEICRYAGSMGIDVLFEPLHRELVSFINSTWDALDLLEKIACPNLGIVLDTWHMEQEQENLFESILAAGSRLKLLHVSDSDRQALGSGSMDFGTCLRALMTRADAIPLLIECPPLATGPGYVNDDPQHFFAMDQRVFVSHQTLQNTARNLCHQNDRMILC